MAPALSGNDLQLWIGTDNGVPIDAERLSKMEVRRTTTLSANIDGWERLTNSLVLTNGQVRIEGANAGDAGFYIVTEAP